MLLGLCKVGYDWWAVRRTEQLKIDASSLTGRTFLEKKKKKNFRQVGVAVTRYIRTGEVQEHKVKLTEALSLSFRQYTHANGRTVLSDNRLALTANVDIFNEN